MTDRISKAQLTGALARLARALGRDVGYGAGQLYLTRQAPGDGTVRYRVAEGPGEYNLLGHTSWLGAGEAFHAMNFGAECAELSNRDHSRT